MKNLKKAARRHVMGQYLILFCILVPRNTIRINNQHSCSTWLSGGGDSGSNIEVDLPLEFTFDTILRPYDGKWSKSMVGYGPEDNHFVVELTYNYGLGSYQLGDDFRVNRKIFTIEN